LTINPDQTFYALAFEEESGEEILLWYSLDGKDLAGEGQASDWDIVNRPDNLPVHQVTPFKVTTRAGRRLTILCADRKGKGFARQVIAQTARGEIEFHSHLV